MYSVVLLNTKFLLYFTDLYPINNSLIYYIYCYLYHYILYNIILYLVDQYYSIHYSVKYLYL